MLSPPEARRLANLLSRLGELLPSASRVAVAGQMHTALTVLNTYSAGGVFDRQAVVTALVFLEMALREARRGGRMGCASTEHDRLWAEIELITGDM